MRGVLVVQLSLACGVALAGGCGGTGTSGVAGMGGAAGNVSLSGGTAGTGDGLGGSGTAGSGDGTGGSAGTGTGGAACVDGTERCPCYGNGTCNEGLVCASDLCVDLGGGGQPGAGGSGGVVGAGGSVASAGSAGAPNRGGAAGNAGATGVGGNAGMGGVAGAGTAGTAGAPASGGTSPGLGGSAGTGGVVQVCVPNLIEPCYGTANCLGTHTCLPNGSGYTVCDCTASGSGGAAQGGAAGAGIGAGGTAGSAGAGTGGAGGAPPCEPTIVIPETGQSEPLGIDEVCALLCNDTFRRVFVTNFGVGATLRTMVVNDVPVDCPLNGECAWAAASPPAIDGCYYFEIGPGEPAYSAFYVANG